MANARQRASRAAVVPLMLAVAACESSAPSVPSPSAVIPPVALRIVSHRVTLTTNEIGLAWSGLGPGYRLSIGSFRNGNDVRSVDLTVTGYTFIAPRTADTYYVRVQAVDGGQVSAPSDQLTIAGVDLRDVIDALFFRAGPMSDGHAIQPGSTPAAVWPDGTHLRVLVSVEAGERIRGLAQAAIDTYASVVGGAITGTAELATEKDAAVSAEQLPPFTIVIRIQPRCPSGCADYGPAPLGPNASIVTFANADVINGVAHELGHAYGLAHVLRPSSNGALNLLMNPIPQGSGLSDTEKAAIAAARAGGIRAGTTRDQALALDLVRPYFQVARASEARK